MNLKKKKKENEKPWGHYDNTVVSNVEGIGDRNGKKKEREICICQSLHLHQDQGQKFYISYLL